jgi:hypothetical protein
VVVVYARVSANENRTNLDTQAEQLSAYCAAKGWKVHKVVKEVGSGINDGRKKLPALLADPTVTVIVVEHKDRLTRFGFKYIETLLAMQGRSIEVVNITENPIEDLVADMVSMAPPPKVMRRSLFFIILCLFCLSSYFRCVRKSLPLFSIALKPLYTPLSSLHSRC